MYFMYLILVSFLISGIYKWLPQDNKSSWIKLFRQGILSFRLVKRFCVLVFSKYDFDCLDLISQYEVWHMTVLLESGTTSSVIAISHSFLSLFCFKRTILPTSKFFACHSISEWTRVDTKIIFSILSKTCLLCAGLFSTSVYWKCLVFQQLEVVVKLPFTSL